MKTRKMGAPVANSMEILIFVACGANTPEFESSVRPNGLDHGLTAAEYQAPYAGNLELCPNQPPFSDIYS